MIKGVPGVLGLAKQKFRLMSFIRVKRDKYCCLLFWLSCRNNDNVSLSKPQLDSLQWNKRWNERQNKLEKDSDLQVRYLYFKINFIFRFLCKFPDIFRHRRNMAGSMFFDLFWFFFGILWEFSIFKVSSLFTLLKSADCLRC